MASARGVFTADGGVLESRESGVSLRVPPGAIAPGIRQEIYFKVCQDEQSHLPPLDADRGMSGVDIIIMIRALLYTRVVRYRTHSRVRLRYFLAFVRCTE